MPMTSASASAVAGDAWLVDRVTVTLPMLEHAASTGVFCLAIGRPVEMVL
jgi:hypothetical protein